MKNRTGRPRRHFLLPASNYYVLAFAVSLGVFFLIWGILLDGREEMPWAVAGVTASVILIVSVVLRELIMRRAARNFMLRQKSALASGAAANRDDKDKDKLTFEKNAAILREIQKKSDAANVLNRLSAGHREVFELCGEYIVRNERELKSVGPGSPRLAALLKGRSAVADFHRYHLLKWAQIEVHALTNEARNHDTPDQKKKAAKDALSVVDTALRSYPNEESLLESQEILRELIVSISVSDFVERAERAVFEGDFTQAKSLYRDALFYLGRDNVQSEPRARAAERVRTELERIRIVENGE